MKKGDKVRLKSGGPTMTVVEYPYKFIDGTTTEAKAKCEWFDSENKLKNSVFEVDALEIAD